MNKRIYLLTIIAFVVGMAELIIGGILDLVADDLQITVSKAGLFITIFALVFGLSAPILLLVFAKVERKRLTMAALLLFFVGNLIAIFSSSFSTLLIARIIAAASGSLAVVLCINLASNIVEEAYRGRAIGLVIVGTSGSLVLGLPIGVMLGNIFHWRAPFILITVLTFLLLFGVYFFMEKVAPKPVVSLRKQFNTLKNSRLLSAHLTTFFFLAGHFVLYGYLTPYVKELLLFEGMTISILYFVYGAAAVIGGGLGGVAADRFGMKRTLLTVIVLLIVCLTVIPFTLTSLALFWLIVIIWGMTSWGITPAVQSHLMRLAPETSDIQQSLNNAALHLGIAFGTFIGSFVISYASIQWNPLVGMFFVIISFITGALTMRGRQETHYKQWNM